MFVPVGDEGHGVICGGVDDPVMALAGVDAAGGSSTERAVPGLEGGGEDDGNL